MESPNIKTSPPPADPSAEALANAVESPPTFSPPPSLSSSPSHEFSFSISLHTPNSLYTATGASSADRSKPSPPLPPLYFDLAPADDIFFHGRLLPLHFIAHRNSDVSIHSAALLRLSHNETTENIVAAAKAADSTAVVGIECNGRRNRRSFSLRWLRKWLRGSGGEDDGDEETQRKRRRKKKRVLNVVRVWKKYTSLVEPFLFSMNCREKREIIRRRPRSFSGNGWRQRWWGGFSAPASRRTSPVNSGLLVAGSYNFSSEESTMEELQNAIQSAITHCKNSGDCR